MVVSQYLVIMKLELTIFFVNGTRNTQQKSFLLLTLQIDVRAELCLAKLTGQLGKIKEFMKSGGIWAK